VHVVEVCRVVWAVGAEVWPGHGAGHFACGILRLGQSRIARCAVIVIGAHDDVRAGVSPPHRQSHSGQVARMECDEHRVPCSLVQAGARGEALGKADGQRIWPGRIQRLTEPTAHTLDAPPLEEALGACRTDELQTVQVPSQVPHRHNQHAPIDAKSMRSHPFARQIGVIGRCWLCVRPDPRRDPPGMAVPLGGFSIALRPRGLNQPNGSFPLRGREGLAGVRAPCLPPPTIPPVLHAAGRHAVQVQQIGCIATAAGTCSIAAVQATIGQDGIRRNDAARHQGGTKLIEDERVTGPRCRQYRAACEWASLHRRPHRDAGA
jgi:hypothetical protein